MAYWSEMDLAAKNGHLHIVQWLDSAGLYFDADIDNVVVSGHLHALRYLVRRFKLKCSLYAETLAASRGHFELVEWLLKENLVCPTYN